MEHEIIGSIVSGGFHRYTRSADTTIDVCSDCAEACRISGLSLVTLEVVEGQHQLTTTIGDIHRGSADLVVNRCIDLPDADQNPLLCPFSIPKQESHLLILYGDASEIGVHTRLSGKVADILIRSSRIIGGQCTTCELEILAE